MLLLIPDVKMVVLPSRLAAVQLMLVAASADCAASREAYEWWGGGGRGSASFSYQLVI